MQKDDRLKRPVDASREDRAMEDRHVTEREDISDDARLEMFRQQFYQAALPNLPAIKGYHVCWLTTTNPRDTIQMRMRIGYEPIRASDVPGFDTGNLVLKSGEFAGFISVGEMIAAKIRLDLYQRYMQEAHHDAPRNEEARMAETAELIRDRLKSAGMDDSAKAGIFEGDGFSALRTPAPPRPLFD